MNIFKRTLRTETITLKIEDITTEETFWEIKFEGIYE